MTNYQLLLTDQRWYDKRKLILERDGFECTKCGFNRELQIHHIIYMKGLKPWEYEDKYLLTLCASCHSRINQSTKTDALLTVKDLADLSLNLLNKRRLAQQKIM
jgi:5-methylcytosine-specific restriction endonuclease McrA